MARPMEDELNDICNLSESLEARGFERGCAKGILFSTQNIIERMGKSLEQAMNIFSELLNN